MIKFFTKRMNNRKGFTLVELVVVIAILGILAAIAIPRLMGFQEKAKVSADKATFATINSAIAVGLANGDLDPDTDVVAVSDDTSGELTFTFTAGPNATTGYQVLESGAAWKLTDNIGDDFTWKISDGIITSAPTIDDDGEITDAT